MTRAEFIEKWADELCGFSSAAFARESEYRAGKEEDLAATGRFLKAQFRKAYRLAGEMFDSAQPKDQKNAGNQASNGAGPAQGVKADGPPRPAATGGRPH